jgi:hypothetical protein
VRSIVSDGLHGEATPRHRSRRRLRNRSGGASVRPGTLWHGAPEFRRAESELSDAAAKLLISQEIVTLGAVVGQDGILRAGWQPALYGPFSSFGRRVSNPPQVANPSHILRTSIAIDDANHPFAAPPEPARHTTLE